MLTVSKIDIKAVLTVFINSLLVLSIYYSSVQRLCELWSQVLKKDGICGLTVVFGGWNLSILAKEQQRQVLDLTRQLWLKFLKCTEISIYLLIIDDA